MKSQHSIFVLAILNVVCCYPSSSESGQYEKLFSPSESSSPCNDFQETHFPKVEYPTRLLDTIEPYYNRAADHCDILAPFSSDVKNAYNFLEAGKKEKRSQFNIQTLREEIVELADALQDVNSTQNMKVQDQYENAIIERGVQVLEEHEDNNIEHNVEVLVESKDANDESISELLGERNDFKNEQDIEISREPEDTNDEQNVEVFRETEDTNNEPYAEILGELGVEVPTDNEDVNTEPNEEEIEDPISESNTEEDGKATSY